MKILIITIAFPPHNSPGALRLYAWAKYWSRVGHQVTVLTTKKNISQAALTFPGEKISPNLFKIQEVWADVRPTSTSVNIQKNHLPGGFKRFISQKINMLHENIRNFLGPLYDFYLPYLPLFINAGRRLGEKEKFDVIISTYSPATCHLAAHRLKKKLQTPWVADYRDFWSEGEFGWGKWPCNVIGSWLEKKTIQTADLIIAVADPMRQELVRRYNVPTVTVENGFDPEDYNFLDPEKLYPDDGKIRFVYTGAVYGNRNPAPFFSAVQELIREEYLSPKKIEILLYGRRLDSILTMAELYGLTGVVKNMGLVDRNTALRAQRDADGLLFLEGQDYRVDYVLPAKIFEFIRSGTPILGIGMSDASTAGNFLVRAGAGYPLGKDIKAIKKFLLNNYLNGKSPFLHQNWDFINSFSRERLAYKALIYLEENVKSKRINN
jgi:glycosyltransferase involved in cell wall biosynthesis